MTEEDQERATTLVSPYVEPPESNWRPPSLPFVLPRTCNRAPRSEDRECPWLTVADRWRRAGYGTQMARPVRTTAAPAWRRRYQLGRWVKPIQGDTSLVGKLL
jgi:hypothetical protein